MTGPVEGIVVTLDAASESRIAIDTAVQLAARTGAPLHGIFVEDQELLELAALPFARQVTFGTGAEAFTIENVELHLRAQAERARRELFTAARRHGVTCTFEVKRGTVGAAASASEHRLVIAGASSRPVAGYFRVEHRWWSSVGAATGPLLISRALWTRPGAVAVLMQDSTAASARLLDAAARIAAAGDRTLLIICPPEVAGTEGFEKWIDDRVAGYGVRAQIEATPLEPAAIEERLGHLECRVLAVRADLAGAGGEEFRRLAERIACDMLIVR